MFSAGLGLRVGTVVANGLVGSRFRLPMGGWNVEVDCCGEIEDRLELKRLRKPIACLGLDEDDE
jgi:hypothetical protein